MEQQTQAVAPLAAASHIDLPELLDMMAMDPRISKVNGVFADGVYRIDVPWGDGFEPRTISIRDGVAVELIAKAKAKTL